MVLYSRSRFYLWYAISKNKDWYFYCLKLLVVIVSPREVSWGFNEFVWNPIKTSYYQHLLKSILISSEHCFQIWSSDFISGLTDRATSFYSHLINSYILWMFMQVSLISLRDTVFSHFKNEDQQYLHFSRINRINKLHCGKSKVQILCLWNTTETWM